MSDDELRQMQQDIRELKDIEEIKRLKSRYFECVDSQDWARWADEVLAEDFHFDSDAGVLDGRDTVVAYISKTLEGGQTVHHGHMPNIRITGPDTASGVWAMNDYVTLPGADGTPYVIRGYGHYREEYVRTARGWRLKSSVMSRLRVDVEGVSHFAAPSTTDES
jgi:hypothetical protein